MKTQLHKYNENALKHNADCKSRVVDRRGDSSPRVCDQVDNVWCVQPARQATEFDFVYIKFNQHICIRFASLLYALCECSLFLFHPTNVHKLRPI